MQETIKREGDGTMSDVATQAVSPPLSRGDLIGAWRLRRWDTAFDDGSIGFVMGAQPLGLIVYTIDGTMITTICAADRPAIESDDPLGGPDGQRLAALGSFIAYSGTFRIDGADVVHDVAISLFPNWVGGSQRRHVAMSSDGQILTLSTDPLLAGGRRGVQRLVWERIATT
ncbi:MAG: lipocalin-like domain-containing protein [Candidatus Limnocylindrales bacterium]